MSTVKDFLRCRAPTLVFYSREAGAKGYEGAAESQRAKRLGNTYANHMELQGAQRLWQKCSPEKVPSRDLQSLFRASRKWVYFLVGSSICFVFFVGDPSKQDGERIRQCHPGKTSDSLERWIE